MQVSASAIYLSLPRISTPRACHTSGRAVDHHRGKPDWCGLVKAYQRDGAEARSGILPSRSAHVEGGSQRQLSLAVPAPFISGSKRQRVALPDHPSQGLA
jgi:hypothetical protein